jgi:hypothetical protein
MKKTLIVTLATVVLIAAAVTAALFTLTATASPHQTCGKIDVAGLQRAVADPSYKKRLERLARCAAPGKA